MPSTWLIGGIRRLLVLTAGLATCVAVALPLPLSAPLSGHADGLVARITANTYDALDRLIKVTYADGRFVQNGYDTAGRLTTVTDERGFVTTHEYDLAGRRTRTLDAELGVWLYEYDANGNLIKTTDPRLNVTTHTYDKANRRTKTTYPITPPDSVAKVETWEYDGAGRRTAWVSQRPENPSETPEQRAPFRTTYGYDGAGRLTTVTQPSPGGTAPQPVTTYGYDELGNKVSQTDALGHVTRWEYDALGRTTKRTLPGGQFETFDYDAVGNVSRHTTFNNEVLTYTYDALNRLKTKAIPATAVTGSLATTVTYAYTPTGQIASIEDTRGVTGYTYDARDRLATVAHPEGWVVSYGYDAAGNRTTLTTQFKTEPAKTTVHEYDRASRLTRVTSPEGEVTAFTYDAAGNRKTASLPNGTSIAWTYDPRNRVTKIEHKKVSTNATFASYSYVWNAQGLRGREDSILTQFSYGCRADHTYDNLGRLTRTEVSFGVGGNPCQAPGTWTYSYDAVGNRLADSDTLYPAGSSTYTYDANDRLTTVTGKKAATYTYDAAGNVTKKSETDGYGTPQVSEYAWDPEGRLIALTPKYQTFPQTPQPKPVKYVYDAEGQLVREIRDAGVGANIPDANVTLYLPDKNLAFSQILEERDGAGVLKTQYQFADGALVKQVKGAVASFFHSDHLSVGGVSDAAGTFQSYIHYSPFGEFLMSGSGTSTSGTGSVDTVHLFAGERFNSDLALYYLRARHYDPRIGRFTSIDPHPGVMSKPLTLNDYLYASADPVDVIDRSGQFGLGDSSAASSIASILSNIQIDIGFNLFDAATSKGEGAGPNFMIMGVTALGPSAFKFLRILSGKFRAALKTLPEVKNIRMSHLATPEVGRNGIKGYHYRPGGADATGASVKITRLPNEQGIYEGYVYLNGVQKTGNGGKSTFFPDHWSESRLQAEVLGAYIKSGAKAPGAWEGVSPSGIVIRGALRDGEIVQAYPVLR